MRLYPPSPPSRNDDEFPTTDPRVRELDRATSRAYANLGEAIETAALSGVPAEVIARYTDLPMAEVRLVVAEMRGSETIC